MKKPRPSAKEKGDKTRIELAETRTEQAESRTEQAKTRAESAETRTEQAETRTEWAKKRTEQAEIRTEQAETRTEQAESALQRAVNKVVDLPAGTVNPHVKHITVLNPVRDIAPLERLTGRQREILQMIAEGQNTKAIAAHLNVSPKTVEYHRMKLMHSLNVHDIPGLVRFALRAGIVARDV